MKGYLPTLLQPLKSITVLILLSGFNYAALAQNTTTAKPAVVKKKSKAVAPIKGADSNTVQINPGISYAYNYQLAGSISPADTFVYVSTSIPLIISGKWPKANFQVKLSLLFEDKPK